MFFKNVGSTYKTALRNNPQPDTLKLKNGNACTLLIKGLAGDANYLLKDVHY
jgi:hypothetical protein